MARKLPGNLMGNGIIYSMRIEGYQLKQFSIIKMAIIKLHGNWKQEERERIRKSAYAFVLKRMMDAAAYIIIRGVWTAHFNYTNK